MRTTGPRLGILYEHPQWFAPLFAELDRRRVPYERIHAADLAFDPASRQAPYDLVVNRMSPSAYMRGHGHAIFASLAYRDGRRYYYDVKVLSNFVADAPRSGLRPFPVLADVIERRLAAGGRGRHAVVRHG